MFTNTTDEALLGLNLEALAEVTGGCSTPCHEGNPPSNRALWESDGPMTAQFAPPDPIAATVV